MAPSTVPISVSEKPTRMPVKISGTAAGNKISRTMSAGLSFRTRPVLIKIGLVVRTALRVNSAESDFRRYTDSKGQKNDRVKRNLRYRIKRNQHWLHRLAG